MEKEDIKEPIAKKNFGRNVLIVFGVFVFLFLLGFYLMNSSTEFSYRGITGNIVKEGNLMLYQTSIPVTYQGEKTEYNFYLRNSPKELESIEFEGNLVFLKNVAFQDKDEFNCQGDGIIGVANLAKLYQVLGAEVIKDENASCDEFGRYMLIILEEGNETKIEQIGPACYSMQIHNCEILKATERFMIEVLAEFKEIEDVINLNVG